MDSKIRLNIIKNWDKLSDDIVFTDIGALLIQNEILKISEYKEIVCQPEQQRIQCFLMLLLKKDESILHKFVEILKKDYNWLAETLTEGFANTNNIDETDASPFNRLNSVLENKQNNDNEDQKNSYNIYDNCNNVNYVRGTEKLSNSVTNKRRDFRRGKIMKCKTKNRLKPKLPYSDPFVTSTTEIKEPELNEEITDEIITMVRKCHLASKSWTTIAHSLGLTERVNEIRSKVILHGEDLCMCIVYLIKDWLEMFPKVATLSKLIKVLRSEGFNSIADKLMETQCRKVNTSSTI